MPSVFLYFAGERLSSAELCAARLDGDVVEVGEAWMPADAVETPSLRAGSLRPLVGSVLVVSDLTAAWVYGARGEPPARHSVSRASTQRVHHVIDRRLMFHDRHIAAADRRLLGGVWVTTPERTLVDLARRGDAHGAALRALARSVPGSAHAALDWLSERPRMPHARAARGALLAVADGQVRTT